MLEMKISENDLKISVENLTNRMDQVKNKELENKRLNRGFGLPSKGQWGILKCKWK